MQTYKGLKWDKLHIGDEGNIYITKPNLKAKHR